MELRTAAWIFIILATILAALVFSFGAAPETKTRWHPWMSLWGGLVGFGFLVDRLGSSPAAWVVLPVAAVLVLSGYKRTVYCPRCGTARLGRKKTACRVCGTLFGSSSEPAG